MAVATPSRIIARARAGNPPVQDRITSAIVSLLQELRRGNCAQWSPEGIAWKDIYLRSCRLYYDGHQCQYEIVDGPGGHSGIPPGPAADVFSEYCVSLLDALANLRRVSVSQSLRIGYSGIFWQTSQGEPLAIEMHTGGGLTAGTNPSPLASDTRSLTTYSVWN